MCDNSRRVYRLPRIFLRIWRRIPRLDIVSAKLNRSRTSGLCTWTRIIRPDYADFESLEMTNNYQFMLGSIRYDGTYVCRCLLDLLEQLNISDGYPGWWIGSRFRDATRFRGESRYWDEVYIEGNIYIDGSRYIHGGSRYRDESRYGGKSWFRD